MSTGTGPGAPVSGAPKLLRIDGGRGRGKIPRYVHVTSRARAGFVEFNFSIGDPRLHLEMILPEQAFLQFCADNEAEILDAAVAASVAREERKWQYGEEPDEG